MPTLMVSELAPEPDDDPHPERMDAPPEGESFGEVQERTWKTFLDIAAGKNTAAIVAHGGVNRAILCRVLDMPLQHVFRLAQDYACVNILRRDATGFVLERMNMV